MICIARYVKDGNETDRPTAIQYTAQVLLALMHVSDI